MRARRLGGAPALREQNRAYWTADDQYLWNGFLSVVISSSPSSATKSTSDVGQDSSIACHKLFGINLKERKKRFKKVLENLTNKFSSGTQGGCIGWQ